MSFTWIAFALLALTAAAHVLTLTIVAVRLRRRPHRLPAAPRPPLVTLIRPVCGLENGIEATIASSFALSYPSLELIFCVDDEADPIVPLVRRQIAAHPRIAAELLVGRDRIGANPKLNNVVKGWRAARSDWIIMSDSNALLPPDYVETLLVRWRDQVGVVSTALEGTEPVGFAAELECAFLNSMQARWVLAADSLGLGYALGKTLLWRRDTLESLGGLPVLAAEAAEDIASTRAARDARLQIRLTQKPVQQPIGRRHFRDVWGRQARWARLRRSGLRLIYFGEILSGTLVPMACLAVLAFAGALAPATALALAAAWYAAELAFAAVAGWHLSWRSPAAFVLRDLLLPALWVAGWIGNRFEWRGNVITVARHAAEPVPTREAEASG